MLFSSVMVLMLAGPIFLLIIPPSLPWRILVYLLQLRTKLFASNYEPMVVRKVIPTVERIASSWPKEPSDAIKKIDSQTFQNIAITKAGTKLLLHRAHFSCSWDTLGISTLKASAADT
ncbi:hypothetical protein Tco_0544198 [Tanacetum coccineum]